jgi:hypothetical protein
MTKSERKRRQRAYRQTPHARELDRARRRRYMSSPKGKAVARRRLRARLPWRRAHDAQPRNRARAILSRRRYYAKLVARGRLSTRAAVHSELLRIGRALDKAITGAAPRGELVRIGRKLDRVIVAIGPGRR